MREGLLPQLEDTSMHIEFRKDRQNKNSKEQMILRYFGLVRYVLHHLHLARGYVLSNEDLLHFGILGLNEAIENFDPNKMVKFETYAIPRIRGTILDEVRKIDWVPRAVRKQMREEGKNNPELLQYRQFEQYRERVAQKLSLTLSDYDRVVDEAQKTTTGDGNHLRKNGHISDMDEFIDEGSLDPSQLITEVEAKEMIVERIEALPKKQQIVIALFYYEELSFTEIAQVLKLSVSRVSQIHYEALATLRKELRVVYNA
ncbi:MAG: FliA/WhiG family RNA polymerase sigma factor [Ignavibacteria bacterium]|nr:FliA/WhiG family RNA polymerase sigma factor [Ignavibacteria bacterium]